MSNITPTGTPSPIATLMQLGQIYFTRFANVCAEAPGKDDESGRGRRRPGVSVPAVAFLITASFAEHDDIENTEFAHPDLWSFVQASLFRGAKHNFMKCLKEMERTGMLSIRKEKKKSKPSNGSENEEESSNDTWLITPSTQCVDTIRDYATAVAKHIAGDKPVFDEKWLEVARLVFDFFRYRYMPEWYIFLRRVLRQSPLKNGDRTKAFVKITADSTYWSVINMFIEEVSEGRNPNTNALTCRVADIALMEISKAAPLVAAPIKWGLYRRTRTLALEPANETIVLHLREYAEKVEQDLETLKMELLRLQST